MSRLLFLCLLFVPSAAAAQGYQLKYVPIPPKQKPADELPADKRPIVRGSGSTNASTEQLKHNAIDNQQQQAEFRKKVAAWRAERAAANNAWADHQQGLANAYAAGYGQAAADSQQQYQYPQQSILIVQPWDNIRDYWGIYAPGRHSNVGQTYIITSP